MQFIVHPLIADPSTLRGLLEWLLTEAGWSAATVALIALAIWAWQTFKHSVLSDGAKRVLALVLPFVVIVGAYSVQALAGFVPWSIETLYEHIYAAILLMIGGQGVYAFVWQPIGAWLEAPKA